MPNRGRPRTPGLLTPREEEVLSLIRDGFSNREIAERLDISLAGAKFHVSEIISKLGVTSREEAAAWRSDKQPLFILPWRESSPFDLPRKLVGAGLIVGVTTAAFVLASLAWGPDLPDTFRTAQGAAVPPAQPTEEAFPHSIQVVPQQYQTLQQAADVASFQPRLPTYIPAGYALSLIEHLRFPTNPPGRTDVHNDSITVTYRDSEGHRLLVSQGFPARPGVGIYLSARDDRKGVVNIAGRDVYWVQLDIMTASLALNGPSVFVGVPQLHEGGLLLAWDARRYGPGWELSPDRTQITYGSPFDYGIASDTLSLDELTRIALSVPFITDPSLTP